MEVIEQKDKDKLLSFISDNDLDYDVSDDGIVRFHITACDGIKFFLYFYNDQYVIVKYNKDKDRPGSTAYEYFYFKTFPQVLEQLAFYDKSIVKNYWNTTSNSIEIPFDKVNYIDDWYSEFTEDDNFGVEDSGEYKYITYNNDEYKPELKSPYNTIGEVSPINDTIYAKLDTLYFEIHPISCQNGNESYLLKLSCNNEEVLKEYINYIVNRKKGLKLLLDTIFKEMEQFKH